MKWVGEVTVEPLVGVLTVTPANEAVTKANSTSPVRTKLLIMSTSALGFQVELRIGELGMLKNWAYGLMRLKFPP
jgi:hypothetical protein